MLGFLRLFRFQYQERELIFHLKKCVHKISKAENSLSELLKRHCKNLQDSHILDLIKLKRTLYEESQLSGYTALKECVLLLLSQVQEITANEQCPEHLLSAVYSIIWAAPIFRCVYMWNVENLLKRRYPTLVHVTISIDNLSSGVAQMCPHLNPSDTELYHAYSRFELSFPFELTESQEFAVNDPSLDAIYPQDGEIEDQVHPQDNNNLADENQSLGFEYSQLKSTTAHSSPSALPSTALSRAVTTQDPPPASANTNTSRCGCDTYKHWSLFILFWTIVIRGQFARFSKKCVGTIWFWLIVTITNISEPILCGYAPIGIILQIQGAVIVVSIALFILQVTGEASLDKDLINREYGNEPAPTVILRSYRTVKYYMGRTEYVLEALCLFAGGACLGIKPGIAVLRCFRVFRILWYCEIDVVTESIESSAVWLLGSSGQDWTDPLFHVMQFAIHIILIIGTEIFTLTKASKGGFMLMLILTYIAYVVGATMSAALYGLDISCGSVGACTYMMLRLTVFDGNAFDFAYLLTQNHPFLFAVAMIFLCVTAFGIFNGLIVTMGKIFEMSSNVVFGDDNKKSQSGSNNNNDMPSAATAGVAAGEEAAGREAEVGERGSGGVGVGDAVTGTSTRIADHTSSLPAAAAAAHSTTTTSSARASGRYGPASSKPAQAGETTDSSYTSVIKTSRGKTLYERRQVEYAHSSEDTVHNTSRGHANKSNYAGTEFEVDCLRELQELRHQQAEMMKLVVELKNQITTMALQQVAKEGIVMPSSRYGSSPNRSSITSLHPVISHPTIATVLSQQETELPSTDT